MMSDKDIEEYHNIGKPIKFKEKYTYVDASRIEEHGTRLYDVNGSTDLVCNHNGIESIVDFKQANRPKRKEWVEDYCLQIAAYAMAHDYVHGSEIRQGVIMMCTPDLYYQEFRITDHELRSYKHKFLKRLDMYHELQFDEKERAKVNITEEDFK
jgi:hypothetical protein